VPRVLLSLALVVLAISPGPGRAAPRTVRVAAAANLKFALDEAAASFRARNPEAAVEITYGASGTFFAQIQNGAPFDLFLSAEEALPRKLVEEGQGVTPPFTYAFGKLVLWVPLDSKLDLERMGLSVLLDPSVTRIAIGNPSVAPYGVAAESALEGAGLLPAVKGKLVLGQNVQQAAQFAQSGNAQAAFLPLSLASAPPLSTSGRHVLVPARLHRPIEQAGVVLRSAGDPALARAFADLLLGPEGRAVLERHGYALPPAR
jgi:molybdate transport system substrate-binding protein